jgi:hypothetical protein
MLCVARYRRRTDFFIAADDERPAAAKRAKRKANSAAVARAKRRTKTGATPSNSSEVWVRSTIVTDSSSLRNVAKVQHYRNEIR